jgi:hypothetical protein
MKIRNEVDRHGQVGQQQPQPHAYPAGDRAVAGQPGDEPEQVGQQPDRLGEQVPLRAGRRPANAQPGGRAVICSASSGLSGTILVTPPLPWTRSPSGSTSRVRTRAISCRRSPGERAELQHHASTGPWAIEAACAGIGPELVRRRDRRRLTGGQNGAGRNDLRLIRLDRERVFTEFRPRHQHGFGVALRWLG